MFAKRIKELRKKHGMTQRQLADLLYIDCSTVTKWETGKANPDFEKQKKLASLFNVSVDYLLGLTEDEPKVDLNQMTAKEILAYAEKQNETTYDILGYDGENATRTTLTKDEYEKVLGIIEVLRKENN